MKGLFLVYTPFQLFIAQQIITQERMVDCVLLAGYVGNNKHFLDIYDYMLVRDLWKSKFVMPDLPSWDGLTIRNIEDIKHSYLNYKKIKLVAEKNDVDTIFISDHQNQAMRFTAVVFNHLGYKIAFFEEGLAHYVNRAYIMDNSWKMKFKIFLRDILYYYPIYHVLFAKWRYLANKPLDETFPVNFRYSVLPIFKGEKERIIKFKNVISENVRIYLSNLNISSDETNRILLLTDPLEEIYSDVNEFLNIYLQTIKDVLLEYNNSVIYIKFHPRDKEEFKEEVLRMVNSMKMKSYVLSEDINLPVEYFLQTIQFNTILFYCASTYVYNGYLFPHQNFVCLLSKLDEECFKKTKHRSVVAQNIISLFLDIKDRI